MDPLFPAASTERPNLPLPTASFFENLRDMLRLALWRTPRHTDARLSGLAITGVFAIFALASIVKDLVAAGGAWRTFTPYGIDALLAALALNAVVVLAFSHFDRTQATTRRLVLVCGLGFLVGFLENIALGLMTPDQAAMRGFTASSAVFATLAGATYIWWIGAAGRAFKPTPSVRRPALRGFGFILALVLSAVLPPGWPVFAPADFDSRTANLWEWSQTWLYAKQTAQQEADYRAAQREGEKSAARREAGQHIVLSHAIAKLAARDADQANVYSIGVAGWSAQDVFLKEIQQSTTILKDHFHWGERNLNLINNPSTAKDAPMASVQNLGEALRAVASRMDRDKDLLVLVLSSHGSPDGFALRYGNLVERTLDPETLRLMLDAARIKNRVVIVSSCYSGTFVAPLQTPDTMVLTAASSDRTSFGCADDRRWTWFGEALFEKGLADHATLTEAFAAARTTIATWEGEQHLTASQPQIFVGENIARNFPDIVGPQGSASAGDTASAKAD